MGVGQDDPRLTWLAPDRIQIKAPAKLNRFLHITGRRADGYHELQTVFQLIEWCDELEITATNDGHIQRQNDVVDVPVENDLCLRAANLLQKHTHTNAGCLIALDKQIPLGAGLGGGSSDAAAVLIALNALWRTGLTLAELASLGLRLGADVPVFVHGQNAWAEGLGEQLVPISLPPQKFAVLWPGVHINTAIAFSQTNLCRDCVPISATDYFAGVVTENVFEKVVCQLNPEIERARVWLLNRFGNARLTGSGSALFSLVGDDQSLSNEDLPASWRLRICCSI
jgi:4-diphosphocytidyl-2-C-methyl-D-erythritol kinase